MQGRARLLGFIVAAVTLVAACGGGGGGGGASASPTDPPKATLPADLPVESCLGAGPFQTTPCGGPIETMFAQVAQYGPFDAVRATTVGTMSCANPREFPASTGKPTEYFWMVRFSKGTEDYGGFVRTGGRLGDICAPFTGS